MRIVKDGKKEKRSYVIVEKTIVSYGRKADGSSDLSAENDFVTKPTCQKEQIQLWFRPTWNKTTKSHFPIFTLILMDQFFNYFYLGSTPKPNNSSTYPKYLNVSMSTSTYISIPTKYLKVLEGRRKYLSQAE